MANELDITVYQGADFRKTITNSVTVDGVTSLRNLTGYTFVAKAREKFEDAEAAFEFEFEILDQDTQEGKVLWICPKATTSAIEGLTKDKKYVYDVERTDSEGLTKRILQGKLTLKPEVTK